MDEVMIQTDDVSVHSVTVRSSVWPVRAVEVVAHIDGVPSVGLTLSHEVALRLAHEILDCVETENSDGTRN